MKQLFTDQAVLDSILLLTHSAISFDTKYILRSWLKQRTGYLVTSNYRLRITTRYLRLQYNVISHISKLVQSVSGCTFIKAFKFMVSYIKKATCIRSFLYFKVNRYNFKVEQQTKFKTNY